MPKIVTKVENIYLFYLLSVGSLICAVLNPLFVLLTGIKFLDIAYRDPVKIPRFSAVPILSYTEDDRKFAQQAGIALITLSCLQIGTVVIAFFPVLYSIPYLTVSCFFVVQGSIWISLYIVQGALVHHGRSATFELDSLTSLTNTTLNAVALFTAVFVLKYALSEMKGKETPKIFGNKRNEDHTERVLHFCLPGMEDES
mmetsp:Transcript_25301/g.63491  ORF Transcript_25301/g.63491 Transcript_25301/m.63491 type:complete len:199 (-) Transcript_25301:760-1356(-)|eukprot:CAMPEP_0113887850 /NCGR_PEP_ID=MMETSP0780_2-20120614/12479_1 /TAXON_ID=652834 /ORGANISM="Palpitomonas bilix" /LENGTH=198 /DNA_ID=CAMNT_0000876501 /DNA_START=378 /DNA_END=974 /DNA_ORIENTATION=- /assembly_acc=CAM_ASM_000599